MLKNCQSPLNFFVRTESFDKVNVISNSGKRITVALNVVLFNRKPENTCSSNSNIVHWGVVQFKTEDGWNSEVEQNICPTVIYHLLSLTLLLRS